jgi:tetratricopeptide (TPR) repeat protein
MPDMKLAAVLALGGAVLLPPAGYAGQAARPAGGAARFEVTSLRAVRPILVKTVADLEKKDAAAAKADMADYDSAWNGVEVYVSTRSMDLYNEIEHHYQTAVTEALNKPNPDTAAVLADARAMLAKYDEMLAMVEKAAPLNRLYDDVARLRIERAHLREVNPALKAGNLAKARKSFEAFDDNWDNIEDLVKERSRESYDSIEKGMVTIERQLMPARPDVDEVSATVTGVMTEYNKIVAQITREAQNAK